MISLEQSLVFAATLLFAGVLASKLSSRIGVPSLLFFLAIGMLAGSDGPGGIWFDNARVAQSLGTIALAVILFAGGLDTDWQAVRGVLWRAASLATAGVFLTAALVGWFLHWVLGLPLIEGLLIGSIVSSTDAAAVFAVLRAQSMRLKGRLQPLLELESGSNDPMAVFLTVAFTQLIANPGTNALTVFPLFLKQMLIGGAAGWVMGKVTAALINRLRIEAEGLYPVLMLSAILFTYGATAFLGGSGFLAVYVAGILLGNSDLIHKRSLVRFSDAIAWLMQITMFLVLGLLVFPSRLPPVAWPGILMALFLVFVARPVSVFVSLAFARLGIRHKLLVSWVGLRGAAPIVLATFPLVAGLPRAELHFNLVFFVVLTSVLMQGTTLPLVARWLKVDAPNPPRARSPLEFVPATRARSELVELSVSPHSQAAGKQVLELGLPRSALAVLLTRGDDYITPRGSTVILEGDLLLILADREEVPALRELLEGSPEPPAST
jgi:cell volume regulation protein A